MRPKSIFTETTAKRKVMCVFISKQLKSIGIFPTFGKVIVSIALYRRNAMKS